MKTLIELRTGPPPALLCMPPSGTLLVSFTLPDRQAEAVASGRAEHVAVYVDGVCRMTGPVTETGGGGSLILNDANIQAGLQVILTSFCLRDREGGIVAEL